MILNLGEVTEETIKINVPHLENGNYYDALNGNKIVVHEHVAYVKFDLTGLCIMTRSKDR